MSIGCTTNLPMAALAIRIGASSGFGHVCRADLDEDDELTIFDFLLFQNQFDAGCE
ncbi:MAG: hypothetical protein ACIAS6_09390 [Phycisphaerales bacterium JB060]